MKRLFCVLLLGCMWLGVKAQTTNHNFEVAKNLDIFNSLYRELDLYYVDTLDAAKNIDAAANYMLQMLDPYTEYYPEDDTDELKQLTTGKYAGIGTSTPYRESEKRCIIAQCFKGMPAAQSGVHPGDIILAIDGTDIPACTSTDEEGKARYALDVRNKVRGDAGTTLELKVRRPTNGRVYTFKITRANIVTPSVTLATIVSDSVGIVRVSQFIEGTSEEVRRAVVELKQQGARRLILDLRSNPGGVLEEAVKVVNLFIPRGREVLSVRGKVKEMNSTYKTTLDAQDPDIPLVVLTNSRSASAAEITAGTLQDYDRALIVGRRTYGKGLVQQSRELPYRAILKLTSAKYYIPSGRCVQAYTFKDGEPVHQPDSLCKDFHTANGRTVRDGGGITPDIETPLDSLPNLLLYLEDSDQLFDYCVYYHNNHSSIAPAREFRLSDVEYEDFCAFMKKKNFSYDRQSLRLLETLRRVARLEGYDTEATAEFAALEKKLKHDEDYDFKRWEKEIRRIVEAAIVEAYYYDEGRGEYQLDEDPDIETAVKMLHNTENMRKILSGEPDA